MSDSETFYGEDAGYEDGSLVPIAQTGVGLPSDPSEQFEDALLEAGLDYGEANTARRIFDAFSTAKAADGLCEIMRLLASTKLGKQPEFHAILYILNPGRSLKEIERETGLTPQRTHYHVQKLRKILMRSGIGRGRNRPAKNI